jgi:hypothetical protein
VLKRNNTAFAIIMIIALCVTCIAPAFVAPQAASACSTYSALNIQNVTSIATPFTDGIIEVDVPNMAALSTSDNVFTVHLPSQMDISSYDPAAATYVDGKKQSPSTTSSPSVVVKDYASEQYSSDYLTQTAGTAVMASDASVLFDIPQYMASSSDLNAFTADSFIAYPIDNNTIDVKYVGNVAAGASSTGVFYIRLKDLIFNNTIDGAITVNILSDSSSGWTSGAVTVGNFDSGGATVVIAKSVKTIEDTKVTPIDTIMIQEVAANTLQPSDEIKFMVPNGFEWVGNLPSVISDWGFTGKLLGTPYISSDGRTLLITCSGTASSTEGRLYVGAGGNYAELQVTDDSVAKYGDVVMHVSGDDVIEQDVTIADYEPNGTRDATLSALQADGTNVTDFAPTTLSYDVVLAAGTVTVPTVTATVTNTGKASAVVTPATGLPGTSTVVVTAEDGTTTQTYTINFTVAIQTAGLTFSPPSGSSITASTPITISASPELSATEAIYWNTTGSQLTTDDSLYQVEFNLPTPETVYAAVYDSSTGLWSDPASATYTNAPAAIPVTCITVTGTGSATALEDGSTLQMSAVVLPVNATNPSVAWSVASGSGTATIDASTGVLTAAGAGTVTVTATANDGSGVIGTEQITITTPAAATLESIAITNPATKLSYTVGDILDITGLAVTGTYSDNSTKNESISSSSISGFDSTKPAANQVLTVAVGGKTATYTVNVVLQDMPIISLGNINAAPGSTVDVPVSISAPGNLAGYGLIIQYDPNVLTPAAVVKDGTIATGITYNPSYSSNEIMLTWSGSSTITFGGTLAIVTFTVNSSASEGTSNLVFDASNNYVNDIDANDITSSFTFTDGSIKVVKYGDVNADGKINSGDATLVLRSYAKLTTLTSTQLAAADVNGDGKVNSGDATLILRYYAKLISSFPVQL